jgi:hypothetical protein
MDSDIFFVGKSGDALFADGFVVAPFLEYVPFKQASSNLRCSFMYLIIDI